MAPKETSKGKSGFFGATAKPFGNFGVEFFDVARRWWLDMYPIADEAARAYDVALWHAERPKAFLNFSEIETRLGSVACRVARAAGHPDGGDADDEEEEEIDGCRHSRRER
ncbi:AP2-containing protein [Hordeum vulgare]|nr:AP2-containing protein [Hordeum vulgare]